MSRIKISLLSIAFLGFWTLQSCRDDGELNELKGQLEIAQLKNALLKSIEENNPILGIDLSENKYGVSFEDGTKFEFEKKYVEYFENDSLTWRSTFHFNDGTSQDAFFIGKFEIKTAMVALNPFLDSPLAALIKIDMPLKGRFRIIVHGKGADGIAIEKSFETYDYHHELPVLGLYEDYSNQVEVIFEDKNGARRTSTTVALETKPITNRPNPVIEILQNQLSNYSGIFFVGDLRLGFDQKGKIRWCYTGKVSTIYRQLKNGNFVGGVTGERAFCEFTMLGQILKKYSVPNDLHHDVIEVANGNFLAASHTGNGVTVEDAMAEIDRKTGVITDIWDFNLLLDSGRKTLPDAVADDWLHVNALSYNDADNSIIISSRSQSALIKFDFSTKAIKWILSHPAGWNSSFSPYLLKPKDSQGNDLQPGQSDFWPYGQHAQRLLPNNNLLVYDNGDYRDYYDNNNAVQKSYSRAAEYKIDEQNKSVQLVWDFSYNKTLFTPYTGFVDELANKNRIISYLVASKNTPRVVEIDASNKIVFETTIDRGVGNLFGYYRAFKYDLYAGY